MTQLRRIARSISNKIILNIIKFRAGVRIESGVLRFEADRKDRDRRNWGDVVRQTVPG